MNNKLVSQEIDRENAKMAILAITVKFLASCIIYTLTNEFFFFLYRYIGTTFRFKIKQSQVGE